MVTQPLSEHREALDSLARARLNAETLDAPDAYTAAGVSTRTNEPPAAASAPLQPVASEA